MRPGIPEKQTHNYARHGVTCLFAALEVATGKVTHVGYPRHRHGEFLKFLKEVAAAYPGQSFARAKDADEILASIQRAKTKTEVLTDR